MSRELRLPIALWGVGSVLLLGLSLRFEAGILVAGLYVGLNGVSLLLTIVRVPPAPPPLLRAMAWCTAAQLPTMLVLLFDGATPRTWGADSAESPPIDPKPPATR